MRTAHSRLNLSSWIHYLPYSNVDEVVADERRETRTVGSVDNGSNNNNDDNNKESSLWIQRQRILWMIHAVFVTTICFLLQQQISVPLSGEQHTIMASNGRAAPWLLIVRAPPPYSYLLLVPVKFSLTTYLLRRAQQDELFLLSSLCCKWTFHVLPELWLGMATLTLVVTEYTTTAWLHYGVALIMLVAGILGMHTYIWCQVFWRFRPDDQFDMFGDEVDADEERLFLW